jgi:hypothetical protein
MALVGSKWGMLVGTVKALFQLPILRQLTPKDPNNRTHPSGKAPDNTASMRSLH